MSIWNDCKEYDAVPFYGFPVKPYFKGGIFIFEFPLGYAPNGNQTQEVADNLIGILGGEIVEVTDKSVMIKIDEEALAYSLYGLYLKTY